MRNIIGIAVVEPDKRVSGRTALSSSYCVQRSRPKMNNHMYNGKAMNLHVLFKYAKRHKRKDDGDNREESIDD